MWIVKYWTGYTIAQIKLPGYDLRELIRALESEDILPVYVISCEKVG